MNLGPFCKDIWGMIFSHFEINFCPISLNNLSLTCKKLNNIDNERRSRYLTAIREKCAAFSIEIRSSIGDIKGLKQTILFHPEFTKKRMDHVSFNKYLDIDMINIDTHKIITKEEIRYATAMIAMYPDLHSYIRKLKVKTYDELKKLNREDICTRLNVLIKDVDLIYRHTNEKSFLLSALSCLKYDGDIVNAIMELGK